MKAEPRHTVRVGRNTLSVPLHRDVETTEQIAAEVTERLERIEAASPIVDTQKFAVRAAYELAAELRAQEEQHQEDTQDLIKALERLVQELKRLVERFQGET